MKYLLTGATGFIGGRLTRELIRRGHRVSAITRNPEKATDLRNIGVELHKGDITDRATLYGPMEGVDGIFHLAAWYKIGANSRDRAMNINVQGTKNVLTVMKELNIPKGVYTSTVAVFSDTRGRMVDESYFFKGDHISDYDETKWKAHYQVAMPMIKNQGLPLVIVMPGVVYGPGDTSQMGELFDDFLKGDLLFIPRDPEYCWSHVDDIVHGHILAMDQGRTGETYILAGERRSMVEAFEIASRVTGKKVPRIRLPGWLLKVFSLFMSVMNNIIKIPSRYNPETLRVAAGATYLGSNEKAEEELGYDPRSLEKGFKEYLPARMKELNS